MGARNDSFFSKDVSLREPGGNYLIVGGIVNGASNRLIEVRSYSIDSSKQLPSTREGSVGAMFGNNPILCGGSDEISWFDSCISYENHQWKQSHTLNEKRLDAAGVQINPTTLWILGGYSDTSSYSDSTEFIIEGKITGIPGKKLPYPLIAMCIVKLSDTEIFVIGGQDGNYDYRNEVWIYNPLNGFSRNQGPSLETGRAYHSCSTWDDGKKTVIIVVGGFNGALLDSIEIYDPNDNT